MPVDQGDVTPELPEIKKLVKILNRDVVGVSILSVEQEFDNPSRFVQGREDLRDELGLRAHILAEVRSLGKYLQFVLRSSAGYESILECHCKFTGWWQCGWSDTLIRSFIHPTSADLSKYARFSLRTSKGLLVFTDPRGLGQLWYFKDLASWRMAGPSLNNVAVPEVDADDFTLEYFKGVCSSSREIVEILADQKCMLGIGNYLRAEILFDAHLSPFRRANEMELPLVEKLFKSIKKVVKKAMDTPNKDWWQVFQRTHVPFPADPYKYPVIRVGKNGRGIYYCPDLQK